MSQPASARSLIETNNNGYCSLLCLTALRGYQVITSEPEAEIRQFFPVTPSMGAGTCKANIPPVCEEGASIAPPAKDCPKRTLPKAFIIRQPSGQSAQVSGAGGE